MLMFTSGSILMKVHVLVGIFVVKLKVLSKLGTHVRVISIKGFQREYTKVCTCAIIKQELPFSQRKHMYCPAMEGLLISYQNWDIYSSMYCDVYLICNICNGDEYICH